MIVALLRVIPGFSDCKLYPFVLSAPGLKFCINLTIEWSGQALLIAYILGCCLLLG